MGDFTQSTGNTTVVTYPKKQFVCLCCGHSRSQILRKKKTKPAVPHRIFIIQILSNYQKKNRDFTNIRNHFFPTMIASFLFEKSQKSTLKPGKKTTGN